MSTPKPNQSELILEYARLATELMDQERKKTEIQKRLKEIEVNLNLSRKQILAKIQHNLH